jgi:hypothetical protein
LVIGEMIMAQNDTYTSAATDAGDYVVVQGGDRVLYPHHATREAADAEAARLNSGQPRSLRVIAAEIQEDWKRPYFGAVPYLSAMDRLETVDGRYYEDSAASIVRYFLANAGTWRGETARRVKAELKGMIKDRY